MWLLLSTAYNRRCAVEVAEAVLCDAGGYTPLVLEFDLASLRQDETWLDTEIELVKPRVLVCLGATAAQALLGRQFKVTARRGELIPSPLAPVVLATVHPSSILRAPDEESRRLEMTLFTEDLKKVARALRD